MAIVRVHKHTDNFSIIENTAAHDGRLSWKAKGIHWYCLTQPDDWEIVQSELVRHASDGKAGLTSGIRELVIYGYWNMDSFQDEQGRFQTVYDVFESPELNKRFQEECQKTGHQKRNIMRKTRKPPLPKNDNGEKKQDDMKENTEESPVIEKQQRIKKTKKPPLPVFGNGESKKPGNADNTSEEAKNTAPLPKNSNGEKSKKHRYRFSDTTKDYNIDLEREREREDKIGNIDQQLEKYHASGRNLSHAPRALAIFAQFFPRTIRELNLFQESEICGKVTDFKRWEGSCKYWKMQSYQANRVANMLDYYERGNGVTRQKPCDVLSGFSPEEVAAAKRQAEAARR